MKLRLLVILIGEGESKAWIKPISRPCLKTKYWWIWKNYDRILWIIRKLLPCHCYFREAFLVVRCVCLLACKKVNWGKIIGLPNKFMVDSQSPSWESGSLSWTFDTHRNGGAVELHLSCACVCSLEIIVHVLGFYDIVRSKHRRSVGDLVSVCSLMFQFVCGCATWIMLFVYVSNWFNNKGLSI